MSRIYRKSFVYCNVFHTVRRNHCFLNANAVNIKFVVSLKRIPLFGTLTFTRVMNNRTLLRVMWQARSQTRGLKSTTPGSGESTNTTKTNTCEVCQRISPTASRKWRSNCKINRNRLILGLIHISVKTGICVTLGAVKGGGETKTNVPFVFVSGSSTPQLLCADDASF